MSDAEIEHNQVHVNGLSLHVAASGPKDGPLVILLHGFPEFWYGWSRQIPALAQAGFRVLAPDQRGYNLSDKPSGVAAYGLDAVADDAIGLIEWSGRRKAFIVGHDWGAAAAWWLALRNPERVEKLVVMNVPHPLVMKKHLRSNPGQIRRSWYMAFFQIPWLPELVLGFRDYRGMARSLRTTSLPGAFSDEDIQKYREAWSKPGALTAMINWYRAALRYPPALARSAKVKPSTLIIWGARDPFLGRELAEPSLSLCENGRLKFLEDATHWLQHEEPERVNELLVGFLREN